MPEEAPVMKILVIGYFTQLANGNSPKRFFHKQKTRDSARVFWDNQICNLFRCYRFFSFQFGRYRS